MPARKCYYETMEVERTATEDELKQAYRRLARIWHPDKNLHQQEVAEETFKQIRGAYEILSDPNERAWYDAHREDILAGGDGTNQQRDDGENLWQYFSAGCYNGYHDNEGGFFRVFSEAFASIDKDETDFEPGSVAGPTFGTSTSNYAEQVRPFYNYWVNFTSRRSFAWKDVYNTTQAPNRDVRRVMEKENKKERDKAKRGFNELVRRLAEFARKKDPRVMAWAKEQTALKAEKDVQDKITKERQAEGVRNLKAAARAAQQAQLDEIDLSGMDPTLLMSAKDLKRHGHLLNGSATPSSSGDDPNAQEDEEDNDAVVEEYYCPACRKVFKSDKQYKNHENSKKHKDAAAKLRKELLAQEKLEEQEAKASAKTEKNTKNDKKSNSTTAPLAGDVTVSDALEDEEDQYMKELNAIRKVEDDIVHTQDIDTEILSDSDEDDEVLLQNLDQYRIHETSHDSASQTVPVSTKSSPVDEEENDDDETGAGDDDDMLSFMASSKMGSKNRFAFDEDEEDADNSTEEAEEPIQASDAKKPFNFADFEEALSQSSGKSTPSQLAASSSTATPTEAAGKKKRRRAANERKAAPAPVVVEEPVNERGGKRGGKGKKGAKAAQEDFNSPSCRTCGATFASKTALHTHLKETKHAIAT